jgi:MFS family permease
METLFSTSRWPVSQESRRRLHGAALISVITALMLTLLLEVLDQTVVGTALPKIIASLQGFDRYTWAVTSYTLASTTMIPIVGKLSDQFGRKWFLLVGPAIFLLGLIVYLPLFLQGVLGVSATDSGVVITPITVSSVIGAALTGLVITVFKRYRLLTS